ncbi:MAG: hypothetical protein ACRERR_00350 [Moraxellaceae bacterium]
MRFAPSLPNPELPQSPLQQRPLQQGLAARLLAATLGSYLLCFSLIAALQLLLPLGLRPMLSLLPFLICAATVFWAFRARDIWRAWIMMLVPAALCAAVVLLRS